MAQPDVIAQLTAALVQQQTYIDQISDGKPIDEETYRQMSNLSGQAHAAARALAAPPGNTTTIPNFISTDPESLANAVRNRHRTTAWVASLARDFDPETQGKALHALLLLRNDGIFRIRELAVVPGFVRALVGYVGDEQAVFRAKLALQLLEQLTFNRVDEFKTAVVEADGIDVALHVVQQNTFQDRELALRLLYNLIAEPSVYHATMREKGVVEELVRLVDASATQTLAQTVIQARLVETLNLFVVRKEREYVRNSHLHTTEQLNCIRAIVDAGAIPKLVDLLGSVRAQPQLQNDTALLLAELCETDYGKKGFCPVTVTPAAKACVAYLEGPGTKVRGVCRLIANMASESNLYRCILYQAEVVPSLMKRARFDPGTPAGGAGADRANSRSLALGALVALTSNSYAPIAEAVVSNGGIGVGLYALHKPSQEGKEIINAGFLLANLATDRQHAMELVEGGAIQRCEDYRGGEQAQRMIVKLLATLAYTLSKPVEPAADPFEDNEEKRAQRDESRKRARDEGSR